MIVRYFNNKISSSQSPSPLFDQIIYAFKINNIQIELNRTTTKKTHDDFIRCTMLPSTTSICFIDDFMYKDMKKERIYYIKPKAYRHHLSTDEIIIRFLYSKFGALMIHSEPTKHSFKTEFIEKCMRFGVFRSNMNNMHLLLKNDILILKKGVKASKSSNNIVEPKFETAYKKYKLQIVYLENDFITWKSIVNEKFEASLS